MPSKKQWEHLRTLDQMARRTKKGSPRERYLLQEIRKLKADMGIPSYLDSGPDEHLPDSLPADADLSGDLSAVQTLFDIE